MILVVQAIHSTPCTRARVLDRLFGVGAEYHSLRCLRGGTGGEISRDGSNGIDGA